jgi:hypothetical protein
MGGLAELDEGKKQLQDWLSENAEAAGLLASIGTILGGAVLLLDDVKDFGKIGTERNPPMPHHYMYGALMVIGGVAGICASGLALLKKLPKPKASEMPPSLLEGAPPEVIEKFR